jgi:cobaltochelatase CobN
MHLLAAQPGAIGDGEDAVDLGQTPGDIVFLSAADTELACLAAAQGRAGDGAPSLRLANLMHLGHPLSVDGYVDDIIRHARLVVVRLLGGTGYWRYGVEQLVAAARSGGIPLALLPGDDQPDAELDQLSLLPRAEAYRLWQYCVHGGIDNAVNFLGFAASLIGHEADWREPAPLVRAGIYWPGLAAPGLDDLRALWKDGAPIAPIVFYRALMQAANTAPIDGLIAALEQQGLNPLPIHVTSLKDPVSAALIAELLAQAPPSVVLNATGFAVAAPGGEAVRTPFHEADCPVLQVVFSGGGQAAWRDGTRGLGPRDIAMNVALPEVDGRILARAVSFKTAARYDAATQCDVVAYEPVADRIDFTAALAAGWARLRHTPAGERRVALVLANYPNRDGRIGNGVGLDTPAGTIVLLRALAEAGYHTGPLPEDGAALIARIQAGPTNHQPRREGGEFLSLAAYEIFFAGLPAAARKKIIERWGAPQADPFFLAGPTDCGGFAIPAFRLGNIAVGLQPARGYNIDPTESYHDPDLAPPHGYLAFYVWLREIFAVQAITHMGKHGNLEWLPGKALALSADCFPEIALGPLPHLYPFIVNDPGEGTQAKRRAGAVIVDHLTPPMTRAESYGPLADLEQLVDEYYQASGVDPRRLKLLRRQIVELSQGIGLDKDCGVAPADGEDEALVKLDRYLCELKEMQIRDGLHVFGESPRGGLLTDLLVALARVPRGADEPGEASLQRALADDLCLGFDPLDCDMAAPWSGPRPEALAAGGHWRTHGDTVERIEGLATALVSGDAAIDPAWSATAAVMDCVENRMRPAVEISGHAEIAAMLTGLDGRFVSPGPSGAPTRGRLDVLPTGRNFYSVDARALPTPAAWLLGWKSAGLLVERHMQDHGEWPKTMGLSAWGTATMRTGGDDIAQALALMGARPVWDSASRRVTGFEVLPVSLLDRPRVDVMLRVSGFFRDAFPGLIDLVDSAARAIAALVEPAADNPLAERVAADTAELIALGMTAKDAARRAGYRVFGSKPGAYGAGLQALIDERGWRTDGDLARAYVAWGGYAYGGGAEGAPEHSLFERRLGAVEAVVHNQDNREHDLLDSDDYYQFEGGMAVAVSHASGVRPAVYHNDHSRPESPKIRTLDEEIARVVRARVVNPKWIAGVMRHGYKGAFEMAATVDYMFAFAATAKAVKDHHFDAVYDAYIGDPMVHDFLEQVNPAALRDIARKLLEAQERGLWRPRLNTAHVELAEIAA